MKNKLKKTIQLYRGLIGIIMLGTFLAFYRIGVQSFGFDEAFSVLFSKNFAPMVSNMWSHEANMWLYYIILHFWQLFGSGEFLARTPSAICAVATLPVIYALGKYIHSKKVGLLAALLLAINLNFVLFAQEARAYTLVMLLVTISSLSFLRLKENKKFKALYIISSALSIFSHFYAGFVFMAQSLTSLFGKKIKSAFLFGAAIFALITPLAFSPSIHSHQIDWITKPSFHSLVGTAFFLTGDYPLIFAIYSMLLVSLFPYVIKKLKSEKYKYLISWLIFPILFSFVFSLIAKPLYQSTYFIVCLPPLIILVAIAIENIKTKLLKNAIIISVLVLSLIRLHSLYFENVEQKWVITNKRDEWRTAIAQIVEKGDRNDAVIVYPYHEKMLYSVYNPKELPKIVEVTSETYLVAGGKKLPEPDVARIDTFKYPHIWVLLHRANGDDLDHLSQSTKMKKALLKNYSIEERKQYFGLELIRFVKSK